MLSLIEVQCPHCGARGQIMTPPIGAIIIGPCPQCNELVVVFCGHILPLQKEIMENGSLDQRRQHLLEALTEFLQDRIGKLMAEEDDQAEAASDDDQEPHDIVDQGSAQPTNNPQPQSSAKPISEAELERFASIDLKLLDNKAYFKSIFDT